MTWTRGPFSISSSHNLSADVRTRIMLFAAGVELQPGETAAIVTAQAEDSQQRTFPLSVEYVGKLPGANWLTQINLRMSDEVSNLNDILVSIRLRGVPSSWYGRRLLQQPLLRRQCIRGERHPNFDSDQQQGRGRALMAWQTST